MKTRPRETSLRALEPHTPGYEAPRVETILSREQLDREILYAGAEVISQQ